MKKSKNFPEVQALLKKQAGDDAKAILDIVHGMLRQRADRKVIEDKITDVLCAHFGKQLVSLDNAVWLPCG